jgi:filamentous hemagglutinin family protein
MKTDISQSGYACLLCILCVIITFLPAPSQAQTPPITSSGLNTTVSGPITVGASTQYNITGGTRPGGGSNLYHSFGDFNVPNSNIANFLNNSGLATSNILGRVTGGNVSNIFGTIQTTGFGNANLFMMNPAGFLFGPNATVNVGGMVSFTSADYLKLADGARFNAIPNATADALLTASPVAAFGFLGSNPGALTVQGSQLTVAPGQSLSLVGGNIAIQSGTLSDGTTVQPAVLTAQGGQINLASVASPGEVSLGTLNYAPNVNGQSFGALASVNISEQSVINVSGNGGGTVLIHGGNFVLDNSTISANVTGPGPVINGVESIGGGIDIEVSQKAQILPGSLLETNVLGNATPGVTYGGTHIKADRLEIIGDPAFDFDNGPFTEIHSDISSGSTGGNSGPIKLEANSILLQDFVTLFSITEGAGNAGNIVLRAKGDLEINGSLLDTESVSGGGNAGNVELSSAQGNILMTNAASATSQTINSTGNAGDIIVNAPNGDVLLAGVPDLFLFGTVFTAIRGTGGTGGSGGIQITASNLTLDNGIIGGDNLSPLLPANISINLSETLRLDGQSLIETTGRRGGAPAADLTITAHDISLTNNSSLITHTLSSGAGGLLNLFTETLQLTNGSTLMSGSEIQPGNPVPPSGPGGEIRVQGLAGPAQSVLIDGQGSGIFTSTEGTGPGGNISINANSLAVQNGGTISAATSGTASTATGGAVSVNANTVNLTAGGTITASSTGQGAAGQITVQGLASPAQSLLLDGAGSGISTDTHSTGAGGNILVDADSVILQNSGSLSAATSGTAAAAIGGTITVNANQVKVNSGGLITAATTGAGAGGSVNINAGNTFSSDAGIVSSTAIQANGGNINVSVGQSVTLTDGTSVSASSTGQGNAGSININAGQAFTASNSKVTTEANQSSGGTIKITTHPNGTVQLTDSTISASVLDGNGGGGSVDIDPQFVILQNSQILADAVFGPGGNINITTNLLLPDTTSFIRASSQFGQQGNIVIQSPVSPASGKIIPLGQKPLLATSLLSQRCAAIAGGNISSFTVAGRDSLPAEPDGWLSSPVALSAPESEDGTVREANGTMSEETPLLSVRKIAPYGFLTQAFAVESSGCQS